MINIFSFSDYFKPIANRIKFAFTVIGRVIKILLRRKRDIQLLQLEYSKKYLFDKSYLIIKYQFKNAVWYEFKTLKRTTQKSPVIFNITNLNRTSIILVVHGFFKKEVYTIEIKPENTIDTKNFKTRISNINNKITFIPSLQLLIKNPKIYMPDININNTPIIISHSTFNQKDFV